MNTTTKRIFFAFEILSPWDELHLPGKILAPEHRHMTVAFIGNVPETQVPQILESAPLPSFTLGPVGYFDKCLFLPERHPRVVAWHGVWTSDHEPLLLYQQKLTEHLQANGYLKPEKRELLPHVTICRHPQALGKWKKAFSEKPFVVPSFCLYESKGNREYVPIMRHPFTAPFEEVEHTADIAYKVRGKTFQELYIHALTALAFRFSPFVQYLHTQNSYPEDLENVIRSLNHCLTSLDADVGCPLKAVSFSSRLQTTNFIEWEMIVDV